MIDVTYVSYVADVSVIVAERLVGEALPGLAGLAAASEEGGVDDMAQGHVEAPSSGSGEAEYHRACRPQAALHGYDAADGLNHRGCCPGEKAEQEDGPCKQSDAKHASEHNHDYAIFMRLNV